MLLSLIYYLICHALSAPNPTSARQFAPARLRPRA